MDRKIDAGALLVGAAALLLIVSLFLDWFSFRGAGSFDAWQSFEVLDLVLVAAAVAAAAAAFGALEQRVLIVAAVVALAVVASQLIQPPPAGQGADRETGAWLALVAAFGLLAGAGLVAAKIAVTVDVQGRERRRRVPAVDRRGGATAPDDGAEDEAGSVVLGRRGPRRTAPPGTATADPDLDPDATQADVDRFAPEPPAREDTQSTQSFEVPPDDPVR